VLTESGALCLNGSEPLIKIEVMISKPRHGLSSMNRKSLFKRPIREYDKVLDRETPSVTSISSKSRYKNHL
jgi:hypothetical protein